MKAKWSPDAAAIAALFNPASVALVGASPDFGKPGGRLLSFLQKFGYLGRIFPINPKYETIGALTCYPDLSSVPGGVDMVVLLVPAGAVTTYLKQAGATGARAAIVCSSGFAEAGDEGQKLQQELCEVARDYGMAILGPNCVGLIDLHHAHVSSFSTALESDMPVTPGPVALLSQSGGVGMAVFAVAQTEGVAIGKFISTGNEAALDSADLLQHLAADAHVSLILCYLEGLRDGRRFVAAAQRARAAGKAVAVLKVGRSDAGERAAHSHTAALAGSARTYDAAFRRSGVLSVSDVHSLLDLAVAVPGQPRVSGRGVGIVSMSGGAAVMMADACGTYGLEVARFSAATVKALGQVLPPFVGMINPVDYGPVYTDLDAVEACVTAVASDTAIDQVLFFIGLSPGLAGKIEPRLAAVQKRSGKPIIVAWLGGPPNGVRQLRQAGVAAFDEPARAVAAAANLVFLGQPQAGAPISLSLEVSARSGALQCVLRSHIASGRITLSEREVKTLIADYGISVGFEALATNSAEAHSAALRFGSPLAVKANAPQLLHKSDAGAVRLNVAPGEVEQAFHAVVAAAVKAVGRDNVRGALIQPMAEPGIEILAGLRYDPQFGPTVTVGMGGLTSEVIADTVTELAPVDLSLARLMIARLRTAPLLGPFRGAQAHDTGALANALVSLSQFAIDAGPLLAELDLNPVIVHAAGKGCTAVDAAAVLCNDPNKGGY